MCSTSKLKLTTEKRSRFSVSLSHFEANFVVLRVRLLPFGFGSQHQRGTRGKPKMDGYILSLDFSCLDDTMMYETYVNINMFIHLCMHDI